ncbi:MAG: hypothetical protein WCI72_01030 [archaeon]
MESNLTRYKGNFLECAKQIAKAGQRMATAREIIIDRIFLGKGSAYSSEEGWLQEGTAKINGVYYWCLGEYTPTTQNAQKAVDVNHTYQYLALTEDIKLGGELALVAIQRIANEDKNKLPERRRVLIPEIQKTFSIDAVDSGEVDIMRFLTRDAKLAKDYGQFIKQKQGIEEVSFYQIARNVLGNVSAGISLSELADMRISNFYAYMRDFHDFEGSLLGAQIDSGSRFVEPIVEAPNPEYLAIIEMLLKNRPKK